MRLPRLRLRTLLIAIAVIAVVLGIAARVERGRRWAGQYRSEAMRHRFLAWFEEKFQHPTEPTGYYVPRPKPSPAEVKGSKRRAARHIEMAEKYEWAARNPWMPLWPDPPEPD